MQVPEKPEQSLAKRTNFWLSQETSELSCSKVETIWEVLGSSPLWSLRYYSLMASMETELLGMLAMYSCLNFWNSVIPSSMVWDSPKSRSPSRSSRLPLEPYGTQLLSTSIIYWSTSSSMSRSTRMVLKLVSMRICSLKEQKLPMTTVRTMSTRQTSDMTKKTKEKKMTTILISRLQLKQLYLYT